MFNCLEILFKTIKVKSSNNKLIVLVINLEVQILFMDKISSPIFYLLVCVINDF